MKYQCRLGFSIRAYVDIELEAESPYELPAKAVDYLNETSVEDMDIAEYGDMSGQPDAWLLEVVDEEGAVVLGTEQPLDLNGEDTE